MYDFTVIMGTEQSLIKPQTHIYTNMWDEFFRKNDPLGNDIQ